MRDASICGLGQAASNPLVSAMKYFPADFRGDKIMSETITFELDGKTVEAAAGETIWQVAQREGTTIPHLCWHDAPGYRADGNCRACVVKLKASVCCCPACASPQRA